MPPIEGYLQEPDNEMLPPEPREPAPAAPREGQSFLRHAAIYGLGTVALQAASVILVPLYTRYLRPEEFGVLEVLSRVGEIFNICLLINGIRLAAFTFYCQADGLADRKRTAATVLFAQGIFFVGCSAAAILAGPAFGSLIGIYDPRLMIFGIVMIMVEGTTVVPLALIQARLESTFYISIMAGMFCTRLAITIFFVVAMGWGVWGVLGASAATSGLFGSFLIWREGGTRLFRPDPKKLREVLRFAIPFVPAGLCGLVLHNGDRFFLMHYKGAGEVGQYALGYKLATAIGALSIGPLMQVWTARMFKAFERPDAPAFVGRVSTRILAAYIFAGMGLCILEDEVIKLLAVPGYYGATAVMGVLTLAYFFWYASNLMDAPLWVFRRSDLKPKILVVSAGTTLALSAWLIPRFGAEGAACTVLAGLMTNCAVTWLVSRRVFHVSYELGRIGAMLALAIILVLTSSCVGDSLSGTMHKLLLWAIWPVMLWCAGVVTPEEKQIILAACARAQAWLGLVRRVRPSEDMP